MILAGAAFLHILVFVYWLGGDLGAFYASHLATDARRPAMARLVAIKIIGDVDMAPRTALILTLPTGLTLAVVKGWLSLAPAILPLAWLGGLTWLALAWRLHLAHGAPSVGLRRLDLAIRWGVMAALIVAAGTALDGAWRVPLFLSCKMLILAAAIGMGLLIRVGLRPLGPALAVLAGPNDAAVAQETVRRVLARARPLVVIIWGLISAAALLGIIQPQ